MDPENPIPENLATEKSTFLIPLTGKKVDDDDSLCVIVTSSSNKGQLLNGVYNKNCGIHEKTYVSSRSDCDSVAKSSTNYGGEEEIQPKGCRKYTGLLLTLFSGVVFSLQAMVIKLMKGYHPFSLAIYRFQGILIPSIPLITYASCVQKVPVCEPMWPLTNAKKRRTLLLVAVRCAFGCSAVFLHFYSIQYLNVADALVIGSCTPIFVTIVAYIFLREKCGVFPIFVAFIAIFGVAIITKPPILTGGEEYNSELLIGTGFALGATFLATFAIILVRYLRDIHYAMLTGIFGCWGTVQSIVCSLAIGMLQIPETLEDAVLAISLALLNLLGQLSFTLALQMEQAGPVTVVRTLDSVFAFLWQFLFLGVQPDLYSIVGACIVIFGVLLAAFQKWISTLPENHPSRQRYFFVLK